MNDKTSIEEAVSVGEGPPPRRVLNPRHQDAASANSEVTRKEDDSENDGPPAAPGQSNRAKKESVAVAAGQPKKKKKKKRSAESSRAEDQVYNTTESIVRVTPKKNGQSRIGPYLIHYEAGKPLPVPLSLAEVLYNADLIEGQWITVTQ